LSYVSPPPPARFPGYTSGGSARIFGLDLLRAAAVLSVTFAHFFAVLYPHVSWLGLLGHGGFFGVELFFVLSGFLIGQILIRGGANLSQGFGLPEFYLRRWFRTLPLFWLLVVGNVLLDRWQQGARMPLPDLLGHAFFLRNFASLRLLFLPESWSLAVEEWFYLLFPAALWLGLRFTRRFDAVFLTTAGLFYLFSTGARLLAAPQPAMTWEWLRVVVIYRFDAIMIGILAAWLATRFPLVWRRWAWPCAVAGLLLVIGTYCSLWRIEGNWVANGADALFARTWRFNLVSLGFALLLPAGAMWKLSSENPVSRSIRSIALWSYAIYLLQHPVARLLMPYCFKDWQTSAVQSWSLFATLCVVTLALSAFLHWAFEAPCTRLRDQAVPALRRFFFKTSDPV
jgi:peptidoglycan/LPS O-acetylase OafA/YrhL